MEEWGLDAVCQVFVLLAGGASFDVFRDPRSHAGLEVFPVHTSDHFVSSRVAIKGTIMPGVHDFVFQSLVWGNDKAVCCGVSPKWCTQVIHSFDGECAFPFFHEGAVVVLDDSNEVFYGARRVFICHTDE